MNCKLCKQELEAYREGRLPEGIRAQVKSHLDTCDDCKTIYNLENLTEKVINEEKELQSNPFLATRIMAGIEELEQKRESNLHIPVYQKVLKPVLITLSVATALFIGVMAGSVYKPSIARTEVPVELTYMNDAALESIELLATK